MDLSNFKDTCVNGYKNFHNSVVNSSAFYFLKEKYDHLTPLSRKIIQWGGGIFVVCILLYYPVSHLYSSWKNMKDFKTKNTLTKDLIELSTAGRLRATPSNTTSRDPVRFIRQKIPTLQIPKEKIGEIKIEKNTVLPENFSFSGTVKTVAVKIKDLNLKEVIQYGHRLEHTSGNIKLMDIHITENPEKSKQFNVSYILSFFNLNTQSTKDKLTRKVQKDKLIRKARQKNKLTRPARKNIENKLTRPAQGDKLKIIPSSNKNLPHPIIKQSNSKKTEDKKPDPTLPLPPDLSSKKDPIPLLDLKKVPKNDTSFKNQPSEVKRKDLLPVVNPIPEPPAIDDTTPSIKKEPPAIDDTTPSIKKEPPAIDDTTPSIKKEPPAIDDTTPSVKKEPRTIEKKEK